MKKDKVDNDAFFKALAADARRHPIDFQDAPQDKPTDCPAPQGGADADLMRPKDPGGV